ncbi:hypothetical protein PAEPH01_0154 [Pancytospora epiphaga]|nr:hypothetical protein PAEPH01_0154 [Pancytospora epiphaga]
MSESNESWASEESIDYQIKKINPEYNEIKMLLSQTQFLTDTVRFAPQLFNCQAICSDDLILGLYAMAEFNSIKDCIEDKITVAIQNLVNNIGVSDKVYLLFTSRIYNVPLDMVCELYRTLRAEFSHYLIISPLERQDKEEQKKACKAFPEFNQVDLKMWPRREEEIFLLRLQNRTEVESHGKRYRIVLLSQEELERYVGDFATELSQD